MASSIVQPTDVEAEPFDTRGSVVRVRPAVVGHLLKEQGPLVWVAIGAPPVGTIENVDNYVLPEDES